MDAQSWCQRWENNQIGFHLDEVNPYLIEYWPQVLAPSGSLIFVPLCGKTQDLIWLADQGFRVLGIEVSSVAVADFFIENKLSPKVHDQGAFKVWVSGDISIMCGDFFDLTENDLKGVRCVYDRASLIAFPQDMRPAYVAKLQSVVPDNVPTLLITLAYAQREMQGPPFSVHEQEVRTLFQHKREVNLLVQQDVLSSHEHFKQKGLTALKEVVYLL